MIGMRVASIIFLWLCLVDGLAGLIIWLDRPMVIVFFLESFGLVPLALPLVGLGGFLPFRA